MADPHWLDRLEAELRRRKLPAGYRARMLEELADHLTELEQEDASMEAQLLLEERLGTPSDLAAKARAEYDGRTFAGRHPVLTFGVAPVIAVLGTLLGTLLLAWLVVWLASMTTPQMEARMTPPNAWQLTVAYGVAWLIRLAPFTLMAWLFTQASRRIHRPKWGLVACAIIAVLAYQLLVEVHPGPGHIEGRVGFTIAPGYGAEQWLQALLPLAVGLWTWWSIVRRERRATAGAA